MGIFKGAAKRGIKASRILGCDGVAPEDAAEGILELTAVVFGGFFFQ